MDGTFARASAPHSILTVVRNELLCTEHLSLVLMASDFPCARPGQFLYVGPLGSGSPAGDRRPASVSSGEDAAPVPFLRRAFSIAGMRRTRGGNEIDLVYRVAGVGTRWLAALDPGDRVDVIGPLGNAFRWPDRGETAWLVAGGVGLPPLAWFARELTAGGQPAVLFLGARTGDLVPLVVRTRQGVIRAEGLPQTELVLATEDGSLGYHGDIVAALADHADRHGADIGRVVVYTCGPEGMMSAVARFSAAWSLPCYACLERSMACGIGTCQSCVVPVVDPTDADGWRYALCCSEGPVFDAAEVRWGQ